ncbi:MAG: TetR/AcrR family transcriptional regulator [Oscillospiraceae bacterium]
MDRRQQKTRDAIFRAFSRLLQGKRLDHITVQEIIDEANVGRNTFYAHFPTKDDLLKALCTDLFGHVFSEELMEEQTHDFSAGSHALQDKLTHLLYHLRDSRGDMVGILSCESGELFMQYFKEYLAELFLQHLQEFPVHAPVDFVLNHLVGSFAEAIRWWLKHAMQPAPEVLSGYFMEMVKK